MVNFTAIELNPSLADCKPHIKVNEGDYCYLNVKPGERYFHSVYPNELEMPLNLEANVVTRLDTPVPTLVFNESKQTFQLGPCT